VCCALPKHLVCLGNILSIGSTVWHVRVSGLRADLRRSTCSHLSPPGDPLPSDSARGYSGLEGHPGGGGHSHHATRHPHDKPGIHSHENDTHANHAQNQAQCTCFPSSGRFRTVFRTVHVCNAQNAPECGGKIMVDGGVLWALCCLKNWWCWWPVPVPGGWSAGLQESSNCFWERARDGATGRVGSGPAVVLASGYASCSW
jgi:hypothetical protein